jgi:hypothetical protein
MWVFTQTGFLSAVRHRDEADTLVVRSRDRESIQAIADFAAADIVKHAGSDYPYRTFVKEESWKGFLLKSVEELDYTNYKNRMHDLRDDNFCSALSNVWLVMTKTEDSEALVGWK